MITEITMLIYIIHRPFGISTHMQHTSKYPTYPTYIQISTSSQEYMILCMIIKIHMTSLEHDLMDAISPLPHQSTLNYRSAYLSIDVASGGRTTVDPRCCFSTERKLKE